MYEFENYQFKTVSSDHNSCQEGIKQLEVYDKIARTKFQMTFTKNNQIIYSKDGVILRVQEINIYKIDKNKDAFSHPEGLNNLEQINNLVWQGEYGQNKIKIGKWIAIWKGEVLKEVGGYYSDNGQKQGLWKELIKNYQTEGQGFEFGLYFNNFRIGKWNYFYKNKQINGGYYNDQNQKNGKWFELYNGIWESFVVYNGEYNNGKKVGKWDILYGEFEDILQFQLKGCGFYDDQKQLSITASKKIGRWVELIHDYGRDSQVSYQGEYQNGKKIGRWDIFFQVSGDYCRFELIGGGTYKEDYKENDANSIKIGRWIELNNEFKNWLQVIITGEYKNGHKFGRWDILFRESSNNLEFKKIGGGQYDEESLDRDSIKIGKWTELYDGFNQDTQITYSGEYIKGKKIGRWDIFLKNWRTIENELIGGGQYENQNQESLEESTKMGQWIELSERFQNASQIFNTGEYNNGIKIGKWDVLCKKGIDQFEWIGGGSYNNEKQDGLKIGKWIELSNQFSNWNQITYKGEYKKGQKVGVWVILWNWYGENQQIGGGQYDENGQRSDKIGMWTDLSDNFQYYSQVIYKGEYKNGRKVGIWYELERDWNNMDEGFQKRLAKNYEI